MGRPPNSNAAYWLPKLERNIARDKAALAQLAADGWDVLVIWECETQDGKAPARTLSGFLWAQARRHRHLGVPAPGRSCSRAYKRPQDRQRSQPRWQGTLVLGLLALNTDTLLALGWTWIRTRRKHWA